MPLADGDVFAGYAIQRLLGAGGMGEVYLAQHPRLPRMEALKILPASLTDDGDFRQRFNREADLAATLWHPHIVGLHDRGECDGQLWITMDYVEGTDAARALNDTGSAGLPESVVLEIVTAVADALDYAHQRNLLHRDVKPANILLTSSQQEQRRILLADFGIARRTDDISGLTATNTTLGSIAYAPPEQLMGGVLDGRSDQYALAATTFHLLTGVTPYNSANAALIIGSRLTAPPPLLAEQRPQLARLDPVLTKAMAREPAHRYPRCVDFAHALGAAMAAPPSRPALQAAPVWAPVEPVTQGAWPVSNPPMPATAPWQYGPQPPWRPYPGPAPKRRWPAILVPLVLTVLLLGAATFAATQILRPNPTPTAVPQWQPYVDYAKQFAVWLTTVSAPTVDRDVQRILDGSTGEFHDDFAKRSEPYKDVIRQAQTNSQGKVNSAGLAAINGSTAQVLVAAAVTTNTGSTSASEPRSWRIRLYIDKVGDSYKASKAEFVS